MIKKWLFLILSCSLLFFISACSNKENSTNKIEVHISVAASLKNVGEEIKKNFEKSHPDVKLIFDFGASGQIRSRIESGVPTDGVLFASERDLDQLIDQHFVEFKQKFAENKLVLIKLKTKEKETLTSIEKELNKAEKIAIGDPKSVPAGKYAKQALKNMNLFNQLSSKLVKASDVRQVLAYVASGNAEFGFVYLTDAPISKKVQIVSEVDDRLHETIGYYGGVIIDSKNKKQVKQFLRFLTNPTAQSILKKYGFNVTKQKQD